MVQSVKKSPNKQIQDMEAKNEGLVQMIFRFHINFPVVY